MKCPHCGSEISFQKVCPKCGREISYGGNTTFYTSAQKGTMTLKDIFSDVFKKHERGDAMKSLSRTPNTAIDMLASWRKPWMFFRLLVFLFVFAVALGWFTNNMNFRLEAFYISVGCMVGPLTMTLFLWEMDIHGNVSILEELLLVFLGGIAACMVAIRLNSAEAVRDLPAIVAAFTEEPAKLLICVLFIVLSKRRFYTLDGLAIGAAVAAGFQFMEAIVYTYRYGNMWQMTYRSIMAIGSHIMYTAPFVGALCYAMNGDKLKLKHFGNPKFLLMLAIGMACHFANNSDNIPKSILFETTWFRLDSVRLVIIIVTWCALLYMFRLGVKQALEVSDVRQAAAMVSDKVNSTILKGVGGQYNGSQFLLSANKPLIIGRTQERCGIVLNVSGISRMHCMVELTNGSVSVRDLGSTNGTMVNGQKIPANQSVALRSGDVIRLGANEGFEVA